MEWHISKFAEIAENLAGYTKTCVISFIDLYEKVKRNFPAVKAVPRANRLTLGKSYVKLNI